MVGLHVPLPTLRRHPRGYLRTARVDAVRYSFIVVDLHHLLLAGLPAHLCENAKTLNRDRRSYSSKTRLVAQRARGFNLEIELKNIILRRVSIFEFSHSLDP